MNLEVYICRLTISEAADEPSKQLGNTTIGIQSGVFLKRMHLLWNEITLVGYALSKADV